MCQAMPPILEASKKSRAERHAGKRVTGEEGEWTRGNDGKGMSEKEVRNVTGSDDKQWKLTRVRRHSNGAYM